MQLFTQNKVINETNLIQHDLNNVEKSRSNPGQKSLSGHRDSRSVTGTGKIGRDIGKIGREREKERREDEIFFDMVSDSSTTLAYYEYNIFQRDVVHPVHVVFLGYTPILSAYLLLYLVSLLLYGLVNPFSKLCLVSLFPNL